MKGSPQLKTPTLEEYFKPYRLNTIGVNQEFQTPYGQKHIIYADWTASGRLYSPIEEKLTSELAPFVGNTHTETTVTGSLMTKAYHKALHIIKDHVGANKNDVIITEGSGMTGVINKLQRLMGFRIHERWTAAIKLKEKNRPVVFITHMEHHSNHSSWLETIADVEIIKPNRDGNVDLDHLRELCHHYQYRTTKIASVTACSNVTGVETPYYQIAEIIHQHGGLCFVDFACSGPYVDIDMHPPNPSQQLDAIFLSPHKFLGGPGSSGVVVFGNYLYDNRVPDHPGGGTVWFTSPFGEHSYVSNIEDREDGGTPAFLQTIKAAMAVKLKEEMTSKAIVKREEELLDIIWKRLDAIPNLRILANKLRHRMGVISFVVDGLPYNLGVKMLNDRFGIQVRGGCSCAGTYGHYLLHIDQERSDYLRHQLETGHEEDRPGWIRMSIHPTMSNADVNSICDAIEAISANHQEWGHDYTYIRAKNDFAHVLGDSHLDDKVDSWF